MVDIANTMLGKIVDRKYEEFAQRLKQRREAIAPKRQHLLKYEFP